MKTLTLTTSATKYVDGIYDHFSWWEDICKQVPWKTMYLLVSPYDKAWMAEAAAKVHTWPTHELFERHLQLIKSPPAETLSTLGISQGVVVALVEE
jgi:hypothetical protein